MSKVKKAKRKSVKEQLKDRVSESKNRSESYGKKKTIFKDVDGLKFWEPRKSDDYVLDIVPYVVGAKHPETKEGLVDHWLDIWVHRDIGPSKERVICLNRSYGQRCPICEHQAVLRDQGADYDEVLKPLNPTRRSIYNVIPYVDGIEEEIHIFDVAYYYMERVLSNLSNPRRGGKIIFSDPGDEGKSIFFHFEKTKGNPPKYDNVSFEDRPKVLDESEEIIDSAYCLDDLLDIKTFDEIYVMFNGEEQETIVEEDSGDPNLGKAEAFDDIPDDWDEEEITVEEESVQPEEEELLPLPFDDEEEPSEEEPPVIVGGRRGRNRR